MNPTPILILSDAPTAGTGLGRITRDLSSHISRDLGDRFRVATLGYGGSYTRALDFPQYTLDMKNWVCYNLPDVWDDFAGKEHGILMSIWDASRLLWLSRPENCDDPRLARFLERQPFDLWGYFPMDASGPHDKLTAILSHTMDNYDRVLAYSKWAEAILQRSLSPVDLDLDSRPHGIDTSVFFPRHRIAARHGFGQRIGAKTLTKNKYLSIPDDAYCIGIVGTNQVRKDYALGLQTIAEIRKSRPVFIWIHIDMLERHWSIPALINDFGLQEVTCVTTIELTDDQMAWCLSACDLTLGIGNAEGFGYPIFESLACGTPVVHCNDGGAAEHLPESMKVDPISWRLEGPYNSRRGVYRLEDWVEKAQGLADTKTGESLLPPDLDWVNLWPRWSQWFEKGLHDYQLTRRVPDSQMPKA
jgi:glycosyltransferase involved in cell wall biosynthesis